MKRKCAICGKEFEPYHRQITCSPECQYERKKQKRLEYNERREYAKAKPRKKVKTRENKNINHTSVIARSQGLSYGKYKAMLYAEGKYDS